MRDEKGLGERGGEAVQVLVGRGPMAEAELTFEQAFGQLEEVIRQLESGELSLEQSLALFEKGMRLAKHCEGKLDQAQQRVSQLAGMGSKGPLLEPFQTEV